MMLQFGQHGRGAGVDFDAIYEAAKTDGAKRAARDAERFYKDFIQVNNLMAELDATRPAPVITQLGVSPTITNTLKMLGLENVKADTIRLCPVRWERIECT